MLTPEQMAQMSADTEGVIAQVKRVRTNLGEAENDAKISDLCKLVQGRVRDAILSVAQLADSKEENTRITNAAYLEALAAFTAALTDEIDVPPSMRLDDALPFVVATSMVRVMLERKRDHAVSMAKPEAVAGIQDWLERNRPNGPHG